MSCRFRDAGSRARPKSCACRYRDIARSDSCERFRILRAVRMLWPSVDLQLVDLLTREPVLRKHPLHRNAEHLFGAPAELLAERPAPNAAGVPGVSVVALLVELVAGDVDLLRVHDDDEVPRVDMRRVLRLALPAEHVRDAR